MKTSAGTDYLVCIDHPTRPDDAAPWDSGRITPSQHADPEHASIEAEAWREFFAGTGRKVSSIIADRLAAPPQPAAAPSDSVPMPQKADQAAAMASVGIAWLKANAPDRLKKPAAAPEDAAGQGALSDRELQTLRNMGNEAEDAADEIVRLRAALAASSRAQPIAAVTPSQLYEAIAAEFRDDGIPWSEQRHLKQTYRNYAKIINAWNERQGASSRAQQSARYSLDADPLGIRALTADAIRGALALGAQDSSPAPEGHWLAEFWQMARGERDASEVRSAQPGLFELLAELGMSGHICERGITGEAMQMIRAALAGQQAGRAAPEVPAPRNAA
jgi:hypothetical protein